MIEAKRLFDVPHYQLKTYPNENMFVTKTNGKWIGVSTKDFLDEAMAISRGLMAMGVQAGDMIGLVSGTRYEWNVMDIAIQQTGAIVVPFYPNISESDYTYIFNDAGIKLCVVADQELHEKITRIRPSISTLEHIFTMEDDVPGGKHWSEIKKDADSVPVSDVQARMDKVKNEELATIIYTSGTTGNPKGVMLSHNNILSNVAACIEPIPADRNSKVLSFLPVCHIYERMLHYLYMYIGCSIHFAESMETIGDNIREVNPDVFTAVPRLIEKVFDKIMAKGEALTGIKRKLFFWAVALAEEYDVVGKSFFYKVKLKIARKLIFTKWQEALGGNVRAIASGSAALQPRLARIFLAAGIPILEGYGLSETSPVCSVNSFQKGIRIGTVGALIDGVEVKIAKDGEILVKGPNVMLGYYNLPEKTAEVIIDGWFHTGDIGEFQEGKFLKITDRKKEIFKTSGGKYIVPQAMENKFKESRFIEQIMVIGEGQKFPSAMIVPNYAFVKEWAKRKKIDVGNGSNEALIASQKVKDRIQKEVDFFNKGYGNWEQLKCVELLADELSIEGGELTPTLKLKRKKIMEIHAATVAKIYPTK
ncbi:MAG: long-chain fatty acid--CoA ligase [Crocinitomicaceae bacterium]|nr:long-chain fatty acid--CoA ligase [Flavobacteriales bacterium]NQZ34154.1 long-chain fatty acid--CoA ligase [Crocinitomicaceae bacterium]